MAVSPQLMELSKETRKEGLTRSLLRDSLNYFIAKAITGIMGLASVLVFVRLAGNAEYGRFSVWFAIITACTVGVSGWLSQGILRYFSTSQTTVDAARFQSATFIGSFLATVAGIVVLSAALWFEPQPFWITAFGFLVLIAGLLYLIRCAELQAMLKSRTVAYVEGARVISAFLVPVCIILLTGKRTAAVLLAGVLVGFALPVLAWREGGQGAGVLRRAFGSQEVKEEIGVLGRMWRYGWPVGLWGMGFNLQPAIDRYFIQHYVGYAGTGLYAAMYDIMVRSFSLLCFPLVLSANSLVMSHWNNGDRRGAIFLVKSSLKYQAAISVLFIVGLVFFKRQVSELILGAKYGSSASLVLPLAFSGFLWQMAYLVHKPLELMCLTKRMLAAMTIASIASVTGNYFFVPLYGAVAAAYVAIASPLVYLLAARVLTPFSQFDREIAESRVTEELAQP